MNNAKVERVLQSAGIPFSYEQDGVRVHLEGTDSMPPRVANSLRKAGLEFHSIQAGGGVRDVVFKERGMGGFL